MFNLYLFTFIVGGFFVGLSVLSGIDGANFDLDSDGDFDFDADGDFDLDSDGDFEIEQSFDSDIEITPYGDEDQEKKRILPRKRRKFPLPITSFKFWTFGSCFFGLTGLALTWLNRGITSNVVTYIIFGISLFVGLTCGIGIVAVLRNLRKNQGNSLLKSEELAGLEGVVEVPFNTESRGKIRVNIKDSTMDFVAVTQEAKDFKKGDKVLVVGRENNKIWVVSQNLLEDE
jgi:membrane protein implicated in regulation of membrane protease activity